MIVFDLKCEEHHVFEAWFRSSDVYEQQAKQGQVECPYCGCNKITKSLMSPNISAKGNRTNHKGHDINPSDYKEGNMVIASANVPEDMAKMGTGAEDVKRALQHMHETLKNYRIHVKKECEYVGTDFAKEARAIHEGDAVIRGIYGEATLEETEELLNEGIDILPVPGLGKLDS